MKIVTLSTYLGLLSFLSAMFYSYHCTALLLLLSDFCHSISKGLTLLQMVQLFFNNSNLLFIYFLYLFLAVLGLCFCVRALSSGKQGPLFIAVSLPLHHRGLSCCAAQAPDVQAQQPWLTGPVAPRHAGSPQTRARTRAPCISRQTPNHCTTREALVQLFKFQFSIVH